EHDDARGADLVGQVAALGRARCRTDDGDGSVGGELREPRRVQGVRGGADLARVIPALGRAQLAGDLVEVEDVARGAHEAPGEGRLPGGRRTGDEHAHGASV